MLKLVIGVIVGLLSLALGGYFIQLQVSTAVDGSSPILLILGVVFLLVGGFVIVRGFLAFRSEKKLAAEDELLTETAQPEGNESQGGILKKNNAILQEWNKTNDARDKLKILEAAGAAEEGK